MKVVERIRREDRLPVTLHVIGDGEEGNELRARAHASRWIVFHGGVYDAARIREISLECFAGCYPGKAGLSVLHLMSLSLPVVTHGHLRQHGPEPSFIRDGISGCLYDPADAEPSLYRALQGLARDPAKVSSMRRQAFVDYQALAHPSLAARIWAIISEGREYPGLPDPAPQQPPDPISFEGRRGEAAMSAARRRTSWKLTST